MFKVGDKVYVKDDEYEIWDGIIANYDPISNAAFVSYTTDRSLKYRWVTIEELVETQLDVKTAGSYIM